MELNYTLDIPQLEPEIPGSLTKNTQHCLKAQSHLLKQFNNSVRLKAMVCAFVDQCQELEEVYWDLFLERTLDTAVGIQLDSLGRIVGEYRRDRDDYTYRQFLRVRILVNRATGRINELYRIVTTLLDTPDVIIREQYPAAITVEVRGSLGAITPQELVDFLRQAVAAGVRMELITGGFIIGHGTIPVANAALIGHSSVNVPSAGTFAASI